MFLDAYAKNTSRGEGLSGRWPGKFMGERVINEAGFVRMACGNVGEFKRHAGDFLAELERQKCGWVKAGWTDETRRELHRCKGGAGLFCMEELREALARLEAGDSAAFKDIDGHIHAAVAALGTIS